LPQNPGISWLVRRRVDRLHTHMRHHILLLLLASTAASAAPVPAPPSPPLPPPQDRPYPGQIEVMVDATNLDQHIMQVIETIPVPEGDRPILLFPKWLPGNHGPTGPIASLAGLVVTADGKTVPWQRDSVDIGAFHIDVPAGTKAIKAAFQFLSPLDNASARVVMTPNMVEVEWRPEILFPAGYYQRDIQVRASIKLPPNFQYATALDTDHADGGAVTFKPVPLETLLDSPVLAGRYFSRVDLAPGSAAPVHMDIVADRAKDLVIKPEDLQAHRNLVTQAARNFGSHHYDHFDFLFSVSSDMGDIGLEHQRSNEVGADADYFTDPQKSAPFRELLPHEYTHSWNGKFMRPADLWSPDDHSVPERDSLLWMYEGQTDYWGQVLAARSAIINAAQFRDILALEAAQLDRATPGRSWRNLQDTTNDPIISWHKPSPWHSWSRFGDYYPEGLLVWLDADTLIRQLSGDKKSLSDFARAFFGVDDGDWVTHTYTFEDVVHGLNQVQPHDWAGFLRTRLDGHEHGAPLDGITRGGWKLTYTDTKSPIEKTLDGLRKSTDLTYSLGLSVGGDGTIRGVLWGGPAFTAGLAPGNKIAAVNGLALESVDVLTDAIAAARSADAPIELLLRDGARYRTVSIPYHDGLRYPHLERIPNTPDRLGAILAPL
jgi:predicted metalloprotease with PDZ domain